MKNERAKLLKLRRRLTAGAAVGLLVVSLAATASADHNETHVSGDADTPGVSFTTAVPIGPIEVPVDFRLCVGTRCVQDEDVTPVEGGVLTFAFEAPSNVVSVSTEPVACPTTASGEPLLGTVIDFAISGSTGGANVSGSFTDSAGNETQLGPINVPANAESPSGALRLCALSPVPGTP